MIARAAPPLGAYLLIGRLVTWLDRQPPPRRSLYAVLLAILLLSLPCYATAGIVVWVSGRGARDTSMPAQDVATRPPPASPTKREIAPAGTGQAEPTRVRRGAPPATDGTGGNATATSHARPADQATARATDGASPSASPTGRPQPSAPSLGPATVVPRAPGIITAVPLPPGGTPLPTVAPIRP